MKAAVYARVSTEDQDLAGQERELREEAARRGWQVSEVYREKVTATGKVERKEYERLLRDASKPNRPWAHLLVWSLDRFTREERFTRAVDAILDLERLGVRFHSLREPVLDTPEGEQDGFARNLLLAILPVVASFEAKRRSERTRLAMQELKAGRRKTRSGNPWHRPRRVTSEKVQTILSYRGQGLTWKEVAQRVGLPAGTCAGTYSLARRGLLSEAPSFKTVPPEKDEGHVQ